MAHGHHMSGKDLPRGCILCILGHFLLPSDHKSSLWRDSHGDNISLMISRNCFFPQTSLVQAQENLTTGGFPHQFWMSHFFGHLSSLLEALAKVMRSWDSALCSPLGDAEHPWSTAAPDAEGGGDPLAPTHDICCRG